MPKILTQFVTQSSPQEYALYMYHVNNTVFLQTFRFSVQITNHILSKLAPNVIFWVQLYAREILFYVENQPRCWPINQKIRL